jgi:hypothetical protein
MARQSRDRLIVIGGAKIRPGNSNRRQLSLRSSSCGHSVRPVENVTVIFIVRRHCPVGARWLGKGSFTLSLALFSSLWIDVPERPLGPAIGTFDHRGVWGGEEVGVIEGDRRGDRRLIAGVIAGVIEASEG